EIPARSRHCESGRRHHRLPGESGTPFPERPVSEPGAAPGSWSRTRGDPSDTARGVDTPRKA
ncbi:hypothetical protein, partial [Streptomyces sp. SID2119]|uniref:hypothetical protein n=1 Tax=Streptomyces sp. SID2119 TaxID=2690253 RepID=UPI001F3B8EAB